MTGSGPTILSKGGFAALCNVDPGRVSQWIKHGQLSGAALVGEGRSARINVEVAQQQLKRKLDPTQMTANGAKTRITPAAAAPIVSPPKPKPAAAAAAADTVDEPPPSYDGGGFDLTEERARLAKEQADHAALKNAALRGELIEAAQAERRWAEEMALLRARMLAAITDIALALPHLTKHDLGVVDRVVRDAMTDASGEQHEPS